ncbi:MAG: radical SAM protein [Bacteroidales bacterium]|nr:radical SAM protein [Bacteroidales bacterium]
MDIREKKSKTILSTSKIYDYVINPYVGCQHGCSYCYARFIKKFTGHTEPWGKFVDVRINAADLLIKEIRKKKRGSVWVSGLCDPYQPLEKKYEITRKCLKILTDNQWPVTIQTRSPLVLRDIDIIKSSPNIEAGLSITTADDAIRKLFEPNAPSVGERINTLETLHCEGIRTYAMIAPLLSGAESLPGLLHGKVDYIIVDRMNYHYADWIYRHYGLEDKLSDSFFREAGSVIESKCKQLNIPCEKVY